MMFKLSAVFVVIAIVAAAVQAQEPSERQMMQMLNHLDSERSLYLFGGLSLEKSKSGRAATEVPQNEDLVDRAIRYLRSHELKFEVPSMNSQVEEARTGKLKKLAIPLLLGLKLKMALILPIVFTVLTLVSLKGLALGFLALIFSGVTLFKDLFAKKQERVTTAYITGNPVGAEIIHTDWNRSGQIAAATAQELAYNYHTLPQQV